MTDHALAPPMHVGLVPDAKAYFDRFAKHFVKPDFTWRDMLRWNLERRGAGNHATARFYQQVGPFKRWWVRVG